MHIFKENVVLVILCNAWIATCDDLFEPISVLEKQHVLFSAAAKSLTITI